MLKEALATPYYHISLSTDVTGVESAVALKNGYALGIALTIGLNQKAFGIDSELHFNSQAAVFGQALKEMKKLLDLQGAGTLENLCVGAGDLYVTVYGGRTRQVGILLGRGLDIDQARAALEGVTLRTPDRVRTAANLASERLLASFRLVIESTFANLKCQMRLEQHLAKTPAGLVVRIASRLLALTLGMFLNALLGRPLRSLVAYDGR